MIDFEKQPLCETCPFCVGWWYPRGQQECAEHMEYDPNGKCIGYADRVAQIRMDAYEYDYDTEADE